MNVMIAGGGTGGHIFPALAIGQALEERVDGLKVFFVGTRYGLETRLVPERGYPLLTLPIKGFHGKGIKGKLGLFWRLPASLLCSLYLIIRYRPKVVIGVGGYASAPLLWAAAISGIPTMIQEQNAVPGMVNRLSSRFVKLACCGFAEAGKGLRCPSIVTGNPVRRDFLRTGNWSADRKVILVLGGSQGARALNMMMPKLLKEHVGETLTVVHQCGRKEGNAVREAYRDASFSVEVTPFIDNMSQFMEDVLFVVCRAGASTIAELKLLGIPAVLVPFPHAAHDHQTVNAQSLAASGAALLIKESELEEAGPRIGELIGQPRELKAMAAAYPSEKTDSAGVCAEVALALQKKQKVSEIISHYEGHVS